MNEWGLGLSSHDRGELKAVLELVNNVQETGADGNRGG
jgi:hypothetical protein